MVARKLCQQNQAWSTTPVEVYNPKDESVHLFKHTTLGILTPIQEMTDIKLKTVDASTVDAITVGQVESSPQSHSLKRYRN